MMIIYFVTKTLSYRVILNVRFFFEQTSYPCSYGNWYLKSFQYVFVSITKCYRHQCSLIYINSWSPLTISTRSICYRRHCLFQKELAAPIHFLKKSNRQPRPMDDYYSLVGTITVLNINRSAALVIPTNYRTILLKCLPVDAVTCK